MVKNGCGVKFDRPDWHSAESRLRGNNPGFNLTIGLMPKSSRDASNGDAHDPGSCVPAQQKSAIAVGKTALERIPSAQERRVAGHHRMVGKRPQVSR